MHLDHFLTQPHGSVQFGVFILPTEQSKNDIFFKTSIKHMSPRSILKRNSM